MLVSSKHDLCKDRNDSAHWVCAHVARDSSSTAQLRSGRIVQREHTDREWFVI